MTPELQKHLTQYREAEQALVDHTHSTMPFDSVVRVNCQGRFVGYGKCRGRGGRADAVAVLLENGNEWHYPLEFVHPITDEERKTLPKWLQ